MPAIQVTFAIDLPRTFLKRLLLMSDFNATVFCFATQKKYYYVFRLEDVEKLEMFVYMLNSARVNIEYLFYLHLRYNKIKIIFKTRIKILTDLENAGIHYFKVLQIFNNYYDEIAQCYFMK